jgi:hypothetical protein
MTKNRNPKGNKRFLSKTKKDSIRKKKIKASSEVRAKFRSHGTLKKDPIEVYEETGRPIEDPKKNKNKIKSIIAKSKSKEKDVKSVDRYGK